MSRRGLRRTLGAVGRGLLIASLVWMAGEAVVISTDLVARLQVLARRDALLERDYLPRHTFMYRFAEPDGRLGFRIRTGAWDGGYIPPDTFDADGFRTGEAVKRGGFAVVGDSFAYGFGVAREQAWPAVLEAMLGVPVANLGVIGYAPWQSNRQMELHPDLFRGRTVFYTVCFNDYLDEDGSIAGEYYRAKGWTRFENPDPSTTELVAALTAGRSWWEGSLTWWLLRACCLPPLATTVADGLEEEGLILRWKDVPIDAAQVSEANLSGLLERMDEASRIAEALDVRLIPVLFPSKGWAYRDIYAAAFGDPRPVLWEEALLTRVGAQLRSHGHLVLDLRGPLSVALEEGTHRLYLPDGHLTPFGNFVVARAISLILAHPAAVPLSAPRRSP